MVNYRNDISKGVNDEFTNVLKETQDLFRQKHGVSIIGRDFEDILTTNNLFEEYVSSFTENMDATEAEQVETLANTARETILQESLAGVQPFASLTMPTLVKLWARLSLKYAVPTEPVSSPAFTVSYVKPYIIDAEGNKLSLPEELNDSNNTLAEKVSIAQTILVADAVDYDLRVALDKDPSHTTYLSKVIPEKYIVPGPGGTNIDKRFSVSSITYDMGEIPSVSDPRDLQALIGGTVETKQVTVEGTTKTIFVHTMPINIKVDIYRRLYGEVKLLKNVVVDSNNDVTYDTDDVTIFGFVDLEKCKLTLTAINGAAITAYGITGWLSSENHIDATNVGFDITRKDIEIGTGSHIEGSLPLELLQDTKAMYQIDGAAEIVDIMSNVCAQKLDQEIYNVLSMSYEASATADDFAKTFNVIPPASYAINPSEWLNELKKLIDILATKMRNQYKTYNGYFVIIGNPIITMYLPNVTWTFNNITDNQNGVDVQYSIGAMSGANKYTIVSSDLISADDGLTIFFVPTTDKFKTYTYYPYTFNVVQNYLNTRTTNVPSVMLTKRHTIEEFTPIIGKISVSNYEGQVYGDDYARYSTP